MLWDTDAFANLSLYKYSSLLYLDTANSGECDIKEREKAEWWGGFNTECKYYSDWGPPVQKGPVCC